MGLKSISGEFRNTVLNLNLQSPPDIVTGLVNLTNSVTVSAYLDSLGQDAVINNFSVTNPGDVDTVGIPTRSANLNRTLNTPTDITSGIEDLTVNQQYVASFIGGRGSFTAINDFVNTNPGDVLTDAVAPRNLDLAKNLNTPTDITAGVQDLTPNAQFAAQYLSGRGSFSVINDFNVINPGDVLTDAIAPRNLDFSRNLNTPTDITAGVNDLTPNAALAAQYLSGRGSFSVINDFVVINPGDVLTDAISPRNLNFAQTLNTPTDITAGVQDLTPNSTLAAQYLSGRGSFAPVNTTPNINPGDVITDAVAPRNLNFNRTLNTPTDITAGVNNLSGAYAAQYLSGRGAFSVINDFTNTNPGNVQTDAVAPRNLNFNRTLNTPIDITAGLNDLSGSFAAQYLAGRGLDTLINDFPNVNPGNVIAQALTPRTLNLNRNLNTPTDITAGLLNLSGSFAAQYLAGRGTDTIINDFNVINPGDVVSQGLAPRALNLSMTLNTPIDITAGISDLTPNGSLAAQYLAGRGLDTVINTYANVNPGNVTTIANPLRISLFNRNIVKDPLNDATDQFTVANPGTVAIGADTIINDYTVLNQSELVPFGQPWADSNIRNRYQAELAELVSGTSDLFLNNDPNTPQNPYLTEDKLNGADPTQLVLGDFLNTPTASTPLSALLGADLNVANLLTGPGLKNDTLLAQIGALELKFHLEARLAAKLAQEALGLTTVDDMLTNPLKIAEFIKNPSSIIERGDADITTFKGGLGKLASFISDVAGLGGLTSAFYSDDSVILRPTCFSDSEYGTYDIDKKLDERDIDRIEETGRGQRYAMFLNLGINKYTPDFVSKLDRSNKKLLEGLAKSQTGNEDIAFKTYISGGNNGIFYLLQDRNGLQVKANTELTRAISFDPLTNRENAFSEPGVENVSKYTSIQTSFVWRGTTRETFLDFENQQTSLDDWDTKIKDADSLSKTKAFRDCSILDVTQTLLESGIENRAIRAIDQTKTKFTDGYNFSPKGSGVITPYRQERRNKKDELTGYRYLVPGLDAAGNRDDERMYNEVELCRTWTKAKPFTKITDLIRWKELHRKERNSVLDRYGNLNIHPSALNVNEGYGRLGDGLGDAVVEAFGEKRARKYMFSIENLAWRESRLFTDLPACEKGANGGRIMWFPPYNIRFTDDTTTNWTAHQFLGRPEPIYTYNNTERSGTLSWDIVVDHPTILNLLVSKEFASLTDGEIDELLAAFWAGCLEYDVFELARIWGVFSESDIEYFQKVIEDLDIRLPNEVIRKKVKSSGVNNDKTVQIDTDDKVAPTIPQYNLFFENDIPLPKKSYKVKSIPFKVDPYDTYFQIYTDLANGINIDKNSEYEEERVYGSTQGSGLQDKQWIRYDRTIGNKMPPENNYFFAKDKTAYPSKIYGYEQQVEALKTSEYSAEQYAVTKDHNLTIDMVAYASPSAPGRSLDEIQRYNNKLASRRFVSVVKWLIPKVLSNDTIKCYNVNDGLEITTDNIDSLFVNGLEDTNTITILRGDVNEPTRRQTIVLNVREAVGLTNDDVFPTDPSAEYAQLFGLPKIFKLNGEDIQYYEIPYENKMYYGVRTYDEYNKVAGKFKPNGTLIANKFIGTFNAYETQPDGSTKNIYRREADVVCGNLSSQASYARRVEINSVLAPQEIPIIKVIPPDPDPPRAIEEKFVSTNVTKREIAQRILNKLLTECDYFEYLSQEAPIVYDSLKSKLKYFTPAFHSMTPEGLNTRLTFLQQCMRPGETITKNQGQGNCDAKNTAFGKPPVCVLRIGDFYHTKIIINSLNISYDPLVWDLNPEGIGVQPMLAKVNLSFKYIGGQGLRRYVDQLQNALSFNYYANADVYDERTFANTDRRERDLINLEQDFFAQNSLDLIPIVAQAKLITPTTEFLPVPVGTIGIISQRLLPKLAGGTYYNYLVAATPFNTITEYPAEACVIYQGQYYVRKVTKYPATGPTLPTDTNTWSIVDHSNFGEFAFREEYGRYYISQYDIQYDGMFGELYKTFGEYIWSLTGEKWSDSDTDIYKVLPDILRKKNYAKGLPTTGSTISDVISSISGNTIPLGSFSGLTFYETFRNIADDKRYIELGDIFKKHPLFLSKNNNMPEKFEALKLNLHPQEYMFKVGDGLGLPYNFTALTGATNNGRSTKYFQGSFTNGYTNYFDGVSETGGIFFKESATSQKIYDSIMDNFAAEFKTKIRLNILPIWDKKYDTNLNTFNSFNTKLDDVHRIMFKTYLLNLFESYYSGFKSDGETLTNDLNDKVAKMSVILAGLSLPLYGYDAKYTQDGKAQLYEIVPNAKKLKTPVTDAKMFGYNPYDQYKKLNISGGQIINLSDIKTTFQNTSSGSWDGITTPSLIDYVGLGNGLYFFKQLVNEVSVGSTVNSPIFNDTSPVINEYVRNMEFLQKVFGYETLDELPNQYNFKNYLPKSKVLSDSGSGSYNYYFETPFSFNPNEFGTSASARLLETTGDNLVTRLSDGSIANTANNSYGVGNYEMKYTWEKLNYEMLDFSNKTLELMLSDEMETKLNDVDFTYTPSLDFDMQLTGLTGTTAIGSLTGSTTGDTLPKLLFYYGDNKKPNNYLKSVNYYLFNKDNPNITGTDLETILGNLNELLKYDFTINEHFISALPDSNILSLTGSTVDGNSVDIIKLSAMHELIFMEFLAKLDSEKNTHIETLKKQFLESISVPANIKSKPKNAEKYIAQRTKEIESTVKNVFNLISKFLLEFNSSLTALNAYNYSVRSNTVKKINKNVFDGPENDYLNLSPTEIKNKLMKGGPDDYTLTMRETSKLDNTIVRNLKLFTKYKSDPIINITSALEAETEPKATTTQIAQLYPEFYQ